MFFKQWRKLAWLGLFGAACGGEALQAQDTYWSHGGAYSAYDYGYVQNAEPVYLYSARHGWRRLPVVRGGQMPAPYPQPGSMGYGGPCACDGSNWSGDAWYGYRSFWVPLKDVHLYQNDSRFRVVTPIPKEAPVAPPLPPVPQAAPMAQ